LIGANLGDSAIIGADAQDADFKDACLRNAGLFNINLQNANFTDADLTNARLAGLDVTGADFTGADLTGAHAFLVDWSTAKGPPVIIPEPFVKLPVWAWSVLAGGLLGFLAVLIYALARKNNSASPS